MDTNTIPLVFFGASHYLLPTIAMVAKEYDLRLVVTTETHPTDAVPQFCKKHNIPCISVSSLAERAIRDQLVSMHAPVAILSYFRLLIPQSVIDIFPKGIINIHPSLLPAYRGPTPGMQAIVDGVKETGVSIMLLDKELDHGPVLAQEKEPILPTDTSETLYIRLFEKGTSLLEQTLPLYLEGKLEPVPQNHAQATFSKRAITRQDGFVDLSSPPAYETLDRMIRAYYPWPGVWTKMNLKGKEKIVKLLPVSSHPELDSGSIPFLFQVEGKKPMSVKDFLNGYPDKKEAVEKLFKK